ncbi:MAG: response regulator [Methylococcus sp.]|nr:MAG: response regulator [Methylococcus sp.]
MFHDAMTSPGPRILVLEGNEQQRQALAAVDPGAAVLVCPVPATPLWRQITDFRPDCLFLDADLPDDAGFKALAETRQDDELAPIRVVMLTEDESQDSRRRAFIAGADEVLRKPYTADQLLATVKAMTRFQVHFWGTRGTLPVPGPGSLRYGGNTSCISLDVGLDRHFVFDAGTGLRQYGQYLMERENGRFNGRIFISHPHWDHLNCLPFFTPIYMSGNQISLMGPPQGVRTLRNLIDGQMDGTYFPITADAFAADLTIEDLFEGDFRFDGVSVRTLRLRHPGNCLGFRVDHLGHSLAYITDNELGDLDPGDPYLVRLLEFLKDVDVLIHDTTYFDDEYPRKVNWGHSSISQVVRLADAANAGKLFLFHHDPEHGDDDIDRKLQLARQCAVELGSPVQCLIAAEGEVLEVGR